MHVLHNCVRGLLYASFLHHANANTQPLEYSYRLITNSYFDCRKNTLLPEIITFNYFVPPYFQIFYNRFLFRATSTCEFLLPHSALQWSPSPPQPLSYTHKRIFDGINLTHLRLHLANFIHTATHYHCSTTHRLYYTDNSLYHLPCVYVKSHIFVNTHFGPSHHFLLANVRACLFSQFTL